MMLTGYARDILTDGRTRLYKFIRDPRLSLTIVAGGVFIILLNSAVTPVSVSNSIILALFLGSLIGIADFMVSRSNLHPGLLSNAYGMLAVALMTYGTSILSTNTVLIAFLAGLSISLNAAIWGDLFLKGHYDEWLAVFSDTYLSKLRRLWGLHLLRLVTFYFAFVTGAYIAAFLSLRSTLLAATSGQGFSWRWFLNLQNVGQIALLLLLVLISWLTVNCIVAMRKYHLGVSVGGLTIGKRSIHLIWEKIRRRNRQPTINQVVIQIQREQLTWILLLTLTILIIETALFLIFPGQGPSFRFLFFMTPFAVALLFGSVVHTTSSELGGVYGVFLSAWVMWLISLALPQYTWDASLFFLIFLSAFMAWTIGLVSGIFIKGVQRMSLLAFVIEIEYAEESAITPRFLALICQSLQRGYQNGVDAIFDHQSPMPEPRLLTKSGLSITAADSVIVLGDEEYQFTMCFRQRPARQQLYYSLCANRLTAAGATQAERTFKPILPVSYYHSDYSPQPELDAVATKDGTYRLSVQDRNEKIELPSFLQIKKSARLPCGYHKEASEFFDQMLTRSVEMRTDVFLEIAPNDERGRGVLRIVGFSRGQTSTKSYVTLECEVLASCVVKMLLDSFCTSDFQVKSEYRTRLYYPKVSIYDFGFDYDKLFTTSVVSEAQTQLPVSVVQAIKHNLQKLPEREAVPTLTKNIRKQFLVWLLQVGVTAAAALANMGDSFISLLQRILEIFLVR
jgi:hypothetical protein